MTFEPAHIRKDFPILTRSVHGKPLVYLDSAASSQRPQRVLDAMTDYYQRHHANVHRGAHTLSVEATELYEAARKRVAGFINAPSEASLVFTRNATEALNLIANAWGGKNLAPGDEIVLSEAEHHANLVPWHLIAERTGALIKAIPLREDHRLDIDELGALLSKRTKLVSIGHVSNVLGVINPIREIAAAAHGAGAVMVVDGCQAAPHMPVDVQALDADFYCFSGHKMCGPTGAGALWAKEEVLRAMPPFMGGGEMIRRVYLDKSTYADIPMRFEAGTPNIAEAIGLGAAVDYLSEIGMEAVFAHDRELLLYALERLKALDDVELYGPEGDDRGGIVAFNLRGIHPHDVATALDGEGVAVRAGHHCAQPLMRALGVQSTVRASFYLYTTREEIDAFVEALVKTRDFFAEFA
ncbi:MAG: cysteine desulfurase [Deinococcota bacterium]|nr:cysteine desulfurase [Deinococcota bacterium]